MTERRDPDQFDPVGATQFAANITTSVYSRLLGWKHGTDVHPLDYTVHAEEGLASGWEQIDPTTVTFKTKSGIKFHDKAPVNGRELTAEDVKASLERVFASKKEAWLTPIVDKIETPDASTIRFKLKDTFAPFVGMLALPNYVVVAPEIKDYAKPESLVGTGPWMFDTYQAGVKTVLKRNPTYFKTGRPYLDTLEYQPKPDPTAIYAGVRTGDVDIPYFWWLGIPPQIKDELVKSNSSIESRPWLKFSAYSVVPRVDAGPFKDPRVRRALSMAINRQAWIDLIDGGSGQETGGMPFMLNPDPWYLEPSKLGEEAQYLKYNVAEAKKLLVAAGYPDGFKIEFVPYSTTGAVLPEVELIAAQAKAVGIQLSINQLDLPGYAARVQTAADYQGVAWGPQTTVPDFDPLMYPYFHSGQLSNIGRVTDPELDGLLEKQRKSLDINVRVAAAHDIQRIIVRECYRMYEPSAGQFMLNPKTVKNFGPHFSFDLGGISEVIWRDDAKS